MLIRCRCAGASYALSSPRARSLSLPLRYQNPDEADSMSKIYKDLDETKDILHKNMETLLDRGEKVTTPWCAVTVSCDRGL